jgi:hypothetical protein
MYPAWQSDRTAGRTLEQGVGYEPRLALFDNTRHFILFGAHIISIHRCRLSVMALLFFSLVHFSTSFAQSPVFCPCFTDRHICRLSLENNTYQGWVSRVSAATIGQRASGTQHGHPSDFHVWRCKKWEDIRELLSPALCLLGVCI